MKRILIIFTFLFATTLYGQTESQRIAEQIAPLMNETVAAVVHVDFTQIDPDKITIPLPSVIPNEDLKYYLNFTERLKPFKETGIRDFYLIISPSFLPNSFGYAAIPVENQKHADALQKSLAPTNTKQILNGSFLAFPLPGLFDRWRGTNAEQFFERIEMQKATPRPDLLQALQHAEGTSVQAVLTPSEEMRKVYGETVETLPTPLEKISPSVIIRGIQWAVLSADVQKTELKLLVQSEQPQAAKDLSGVFEMLLDAFIDWAKNDVQYKNFVEVTGLKHDEVRGIAKTFLPQPQGDKLVLTLNEQTLKEKGKRFYDVPAVLTELAQSRSRQAKCLKNLQQIGLALHNYHDSQRMLPPAYTVDKDGKPLHSWRVLILPFLEQVELYEKIRRDEPWDSDYNKQFHNQCPAFLQCPEMVLKNPEIKNNGLTTYSVIVGKNAWPEGAKRYEFKMITDGMSNTLAVVERKTPVCWMDPTQEITQENAGKGINKDDAGIGAPHSAGQLFGTNVCLFDGYVRMVKENLKLPVLRALITRNGEESVIIDDPNEE